MGKHKKPRHRRNRNKEAKQEQQQQQQQKAAETSSPPLLLRIRHSDPQTRLAALSALAQRPQPKFDAALWQAVCEQVVVRPNSTVAQLSIGTIAATILAEWTSGGGPAAAARDSNNYSMTLEAQNNLTAGWPLVLQGQLQTCLTMWKDPTSRHHELWGQCAWQCLFAWSSLIEYNPVVMDRLQQGTSRSDSLNLLKEWLLATTNNANGAATTRADIADLRVKIAETTTRALHSLLQDNPAVVEPWWDDAACDSSWLTEYLPALLKSTSSLSPVTRLHLVGVWMTMRNILTDEATFQAPAVLQDAVQTLQDCLVIPSHETTLEAWQQRYQKATDQTQDDLLERQVLQKQSEKHETARQIARRHAACKIPGKMKTDDGDDNQVEAMDDGDGEGASPESGQKPIERRDHVQAWEEMVQTWELSLRPLELALEIIAHLTAVAPDDAVMMDEDDADFAMQSAVWDPILKQHFQELPTRLFSCFQKLYCPESIALPPPMAEHWSDLQSKASTGLGHCFVQMSRDSQGAAILGMTPAQLWKTLFTAVRNTSVVAIGRQAALGLIVVVLQNQPDMCKEATPDELDFLLSLLQSNEESPPVVREAVVILGILCCQEEHSAAVNERVGTALLYRLSNNDEPIVVRAEVLNVLMDIYGEDDRHPAVFEKLSVLSHFERSVPILKQQISQVNRHTVDSNDLEYWRETALNVARFIAYKQGC